MKLFISLIYFFSFIFIPLTAQVKQIEWISIEEAMRRNQFKPKPFLIDVYTDWCGWCKVMDEKTFKNPVITEYIAQYFHAVKLNAEQKEAIIFKDKTYSFIPEGRRGYNEFAAAILNGKLSYPSIVFMNENAEIILPLPGYTKAPQFDPIIRYIGSADYKKMSWEQFQQTYKTPIPSE